jgi:cystathionine beta-lyase
VEELEKVGDICRRHGVYVVSDEIHCDFTLPGHTHTVFPQAVPALAERSVVCTAPSKSFNLAGLQSSNIWIPGGETRAKFRKEIDRSGYSQLNSLGLVACQAAYEQGGEWLDQCKAYLRGNLDLLRDFLAKNLPEIKLVEPEGTYFAWLDCSGLGLSKRDLNDLVISKAKLWLDAGYIFGGGAEQFQRVVLACPKKTLEQALRQLERAVRA